MAQHAQVGKAGLGGGGGGVWPWGSQSFTTRDALASGHALSQRTISSSMPVCLPVRLRRRLFTLTGNYTQRKLQYKGKVDEPKRGVTACGLR